ncbi:MAG: hypothetical protein M3N93_06620 [Acidobacteriota bacterium]|nr:hypothetical protein [Acidobacteriota bacterium]
MLESLSEYAKSIRTLHASWVVSLRVEGSTYSLDITRTKDAREAFGELQNKALNFWPGYAA